MYIYPFVYTIAFSISPKKGFCYTTSCLLCFVLITVKMSGLTSVTLAILANE